MLTATDQKPQKSLKGDIVASTRRGSNGSASSVDLRAGRGVGADIIFILGSLDWDWRGLWCGLEDRLPSGVEYLTNSAISS